MNGKWSSLLRMFPLMVAICSGCGQGDTNGADEPAGNTTLSCRDLPTCSPDDQQCLELREWCENIYSEEEEFFPVEPSCPAIHGIKGTYNRYTEECEYEEYYWDTWEEPEPDMFDESGMPLPCTSPYDCDFGLCLETSEGRFCSKPCVDECEQGWRCEWVIINGEDPQFVCIPPWYDICLSSEKDCGQCRNKDACITNQEGTFCSSFCDTDQDCPEYYICTPEQRCFPQSGSCLCRESDPAPAMMVCKKENKHGTCWGTKECLGREGWRCDAQTPGPELCDGLDNNCNGQVDEGMPDTDLDEILDCFDPDDDNDKVPDKFDNCPLIPNPHQEDRDRDGTGDACEVNSHG